MPVSNWKVSKRGTPPFASGEGAVRMAQPANCYSLMEILTEFPQVLTLEMNSVPLRSLQKVPTVL